MWINYTVIGGWMRLQWVEWGWRGINRGFCGWLNLSWGWMRLLGINWGGWGLIESFLGLDEVAIRLNKAAVGLAVVPWIFPCLGLERRDAEPSVHLLWSVGWLWGGYCRHAMMLWLSLEATTGATLTPNTHNKHSHQILTTTLTPNTHTKHSHQTLTTDTHTKLSQQNTHNTLGKYLELCWEKLLNLS